MHVDLRIWKL